ncbi:MAG: enoyl-CoA hydratase/isomerase family protein [Candidatus Sungbacteria bacterium]|nr:enoyl-CoA hydratase/isomerase family protein [Candidatus Sungbacteria bacterium]
MDKEYTHILYETTDDGITTITLNRPEVRNAFNDKMRTELVLALYRFAHAEDEKVLILTGAGRAFSTGEDLRNIDLGASNQEMRKFAEEVLRDYHNIVRALLLIGKPIVAMLNGAAAGAGLSISLACDFRLADYGWEHKNIFPAFASMGLIPDSGMVLTLPRYISSGFNQHVRTWLYDPNFKGVTFEEAFGLGVIDSVYNSTMGYNFPTFVRNYAGRFAKASPLAFSSTKTSLNELLMRELNERVFPWELRAQTACLQSDYFKEKVRAFLEKQKVREVK